MGNNPNTSTPDPITGRRGFKGTNLPVINASWNDCREFIKNLIGKTIGGYRLPTEAKWEYACSAGTTSYSYGNSLTKDDANIEGSAYTKAVGSYKPNAFGLYDMHGNVREWCEDWYDKYAAGSVTDSKGPAKGTYRGIAWRTFRMQSGGGSFGISGIRRAATKVLLLCRFPFSKDKIVIKPRPSYITIVLVLKLNWTLKVSPK